MIIEGVVCVYEYKFALFCRRHRGEVEAEGGGESPARDVWDLKPLLFITDRESRVDKYYMHIDEVAGCFIVSGSLQLFYLILLQIRHWNDAYF